MSATAGTIMGSGKDRSGAARSGKGEAWTGEFWCGRARWATVGRDKDIYMPRKRPPKDIWMNTIRPKVWERDQGRCQGPYCRDTLPWSLSLETCHIDHVRSGKLGTNALSNLRTLCRRCHVLRSDHRHRGMIAKALADGIIPPDWRSLVWDD